MPRKPTEKVVEHRITLGTYERQVVSDLTTSYSFNKVASTIISLISDVSAMTLIAAAFGLYLDRILDPNWREITQDMTNGQLNDWLETQNLVGGGIGLILGGLLGGPLGAVAGAGAGVAAVEGAEAGLDAVGGLIQENTSPSTTAFIALSIYRFGEGLKSLNPSNNNNQFGAI